MTAVPRLRRFPSITWRGDVNCGGEGTVFSALGPESGTEVVTCLSADSRAEVDDMLARALAAGGKPWKPAMDYGFMYGVSFQDPDGHVWEVMHMDAEVAANGPPKD